MLRPLAPIGVIFLCAVGVSGSVGCKQNSKAVSAADASPPSSSEDAGSGEPEKLWDPAILPIFKGGAAAGTMDANNRYISTIMLLPGESHVYPNCSGILLNQRVALTAASCVCPARQAPPRSVPEKGPIGPSDCTERTFIKTVRLGPIGDFEFPEESVVRRFGRVNGQVRVHPSFKLELDAQGSVLSTQADLAIIVLDRPVRMDVPRIPLAETEVQENETLVMAGYGDDERFRDIDGIRYFRNNKVTRLQGSGGKVLYEQQGAFVYNGYTGGPCFREDKNQRWLVGIASVGSEQELSFTSTYFFRDWLHAELQRVASADSPSMPATQHPQ